MTDKKELEIAIIKAGYTKQQVAARLGLSAMGFYKKINNITEFKASEIAIMQKMLNINNIEAIFFANNVE